MPKGSPSKWEVVPARRSSDSTATRRARTILIVLVVVAVMAPIALVYTMVNSNKTVDLSSVDPRGRAIADATAHQALTGMKIKVPTSQTFNPDTGTAPEAEYEGDEMTVQLPYQTDAVTWTGFERQTFGGPEGNTVFEVHDYLLVPNMDDYLEDGGFHPDGTPIDEENPLPTEDGESSGEEETTEDGEPATAGSTEDEESPAPTETPTDGVPEVEGAESDEEEGDETTGEQSNTSDQERIVLEGVRPYVLSVTVLLTTEGPRLAAAPSLAPWTESDAPAAGESDYSNYSSVSVDVTNQAADQIGRWALAYAEDDRAELLEITGDPNTEHEYQGLGGFTIPNESGSVQILSAIEVNEGEQVLVRARVLLEENRAHREETELPYRMYSDFDLLISNANDATPRVAAWGPAGSAASLTSYVNAVTED